MLDQTCNATLAKNAQYQNVDKSVFVMLLLFFSFAKSARLFNVLKKHKCPNRRKLPGKA